MNLNFSRKTYRPMPHPTTESFPRRASAKTMIPRQGELILRRRNLFSTMDDRLARGHLWIQGPPGAGKTVLVADYVTHHAPGSHYWFETDLLDSDPVHLFTSFPDAFAHPAADTSGPLSLPRPHPEDMARPALFARKFFRTLFAAIEDDFLLVIDNIHELPDNSPTLEAISVCLEEIPINSRAVLVSRRNTPPVFARMKTSGRLQVVPADRLRFSREEIRQVAALYDHDSDMDEERISLLQKTTAGWAAGLTLLLRGGTGSLSGAGSLDNIDYQEVFDYFTGVVFADFNDEEKSLLIRAALLPDIRPDVLDRFHGGRPSGDFFARLSRDNFFTYAMDDRKKVFQFHPLFTEFLLKQAAMTIPIEERIGMRGRAADFLVDAGQPEEAVEILLHPDTFQQAMPLIKAIGMRLLEQGSFRTLVRWWERLPVKNTEQDPWLLFYFGNARKPFAPLDAITMLRESFKLFAAQDNIPGGLLAAAALIDSIVSFLSDMAELDPFLDHLLSHLSPATFSARNDFENILLANGLYRGLVMRRPDHPDLEAWERIVIRQDGTSPAIVLHRLWTGRFVEARSTLDRIYANRTKVVSQLQMSVLNALEIQYYVVTDQLTKCLESVDHSLNFIAKSNVRIWEFHLLILAAACCVNCGERRKAAKYLAGASNIQSSARLLDQSYYHVIRTHEALLDGNLQAADRHRQAALDMALHLGMPSYSMWCWYGAALVAVFLGNNDRARDCFKRLLRLADRPGNPWFTCQAHLGLAFMHLRRARSTRALNHLRLGLAIAAGENYMSFSFFLPEMMVFLAVTALEEKIEEEYVRRFIYHNNLMPAEPPLHLENWPWALKIFTLGEFRVFREGRRVDMESRAWKKPVQLLLALVALGGAGGRRVGKARLADIFWPDSDGDEQAASLKVTLYRLRKLLAVPNIILQKDNWLSLNSALCWVDCWEFERRATDLHATGGESRSKEETVRGIIAEYTGDFLAAYENTPWLTPYRDHLRTIHRNVLQRVNRPAPPEGQTMPERLVP